MGIIIARLVPSVNDARMKRQSATIAMPEEAKILGSILSERRPARGKEAPGQQAGRRAPARPSEG